MDRVTSLSDYRTMLRTLMDGCGTVDTNGVLMASALESLIREGRLYVRRFPGGAAAYVDQGRWYELYYHRAGGAPLPDLRADKPVAAALLFRTGEAAPATALTDAGFRLHKTSLHLTLDPGRLSYDPEVRLAASRRRLEAGGITLGPCPDGLLPRVRALWFETLDPSDVPADHLSPGDGSAILCARDRDGLVVGGQWRRRTGVRMETRHTAVHPDFRRMGVAEGLLLIPVLYARERGLHTVHTWVSRDNLPSLALHRSLGFAPDGRASVQYLLEETI